MLWTDGGIFESVILVILVGIHCRSSGSHIRRHLVVIRFLGVTCGGDEGGEGNPPRPVLAVDHSCPERRFESVFQSSEKVELDADTRGGSVGKSSFALQGFA